MARRCGAVNPGPYRFGGRHFRRRFDAPTTPPVERVIRVDQKLRWIIAPPPRLSFASRRSFLLVEPPARRRRMAGQVFLGGKDWRRRRKYAAPDRSSGESAPPSLPPSLPLQPPNSSRCCSGGERGEGREAATGTPLPH